GGGRRSVGRGGGGWGVGRGGRAVARLSSGPETVTAPSSASRRAGTRASSWVGLSRTVVRSVPFHCTVALASNKAPVRVSVKAALPSTAVPALRPLSDGGPNAPSPLPWLPSRALKNSVPPTL